MNPLHEKWPVVEKNLRQAFDIYKIYVSEDLQREAEEYLDAREWLLAWDSMANADWISSQFYWYFLATAARNMILD